MEELDKSKQQEEPQPLQKTSSVIVIEEIMQIPNKTVCFDLMFRGAFGNTIQMWRSYEDLIASGYQGSVGIRYLGKAGGGPCIAHIPINSVGQQLQLLVSKGFALERLYFCQAPPDHRRIIQGELQCNPEYCFYYSTYPAPMRQALEKAGKHIRGLQAKLLLQSYLSPASWDDLQELLTIYPTAVIELTAFTCNIGWATGRNTIIWEVRDY